MCKTVKTELKSADRVSDRKGLPSIHHTDITKCGADPVGGAA